MLDQMKRMMLNVHNAVGCNQIFSMGQREEDPLPVYAWSLEYSRNAFDGIGSYEVPYLKIMLGLDGSRQYRRTEKRMKLVRVDNASIFERPEMGALKQWFERVDRFGWLNERLSAEREDFWCDADTSYYYKHLFLRGLYAHNFEVLDGEGNERGVREIYVEFMTDVPLGKIAKDYDGVTRDIWSFEPDATDLEKELLRFVVYKMNVQKTWGQNDR